MTLRRDVRTHQMLAGAVQTDADINKGATYSVGRSHVKDIPQTQCFGGNYSLFDHKHVFE